MSVKTEEMERLAAKFRTDFGLGQAEAVNAKTLLRRCNIITVYRGMSADVCGLSVKSPSGDRFMLVNSNNPRARQHFTIAHELYHLYYDKNPHPHLCKPDGRSKEEKEADQFAAALLMPKEGILGMLPHEAIIRKTMNLAHVLRLEQYFQVSRTAILYRLRQLSFISEAQLQDLKAIPVKESARMYGYDTTLYESGNAGLVIGDYGEKARLLFEQERISEGHYEEFLKLIGYGGKD